MSHPELIHFSRVEELFNDGNLDEALEIIDDFIQLEGIDFQQKYNLNFLKGLILFYQSKSGDVVKLGKEIYKESQNLGEHLHAIDGLFFMIIGLCLDYKYNEAFEFIEKAEVLLKNLTNVPRNRLIKSELRINLVKAWINLEIGNIDLAEKDLEEILSLEKEIGVTFEILFATILNARIVFQGKAEYDLALNYRNKALSLAKTIKFNHFWIALCQLHIGWYYSEMGEFDKSLKHYMKSVKIFRKVNNNWFISVALNNLGCDNVHLGKYKVASDYFKECIFYYENKIQSPGIEFPLCNLLEVALELNDIKLAQKCYDQLESLYNQKKDETVVLFYQLSKVLMLKRSSRIRDKAEAEKILKQMVGTETIWYRNNIDVLIHLCDLLLSEYRFNNNNEVLDELNHYIAKLMNIAEKSHSYITFCETFILQAKLALLNFNTKAARRFLTQAQKIAESHGIKRLAMKISNEHDELLRQKELWENLKKSKASISERWELVGLNEQIEDMVKKRMKILEPIDEEPVHLLIVSKGGVPFFSQTFKEDASFEEHLFGGFFTTIDAFIKANFSEGLDRAIFGEHTLLMNALEPFVICYIFKGQSYLAQKRIGLFADKIQSDEEIWQVFEKFYQMNQKIEFKDIPSLEPLITDIFITKNIVLSES